MWLWKIEEEKIKSGKEKGMMPIRCYLPEWEKDIVVLFHDIAKSAVAYTAEIIDVAISKVKRKHREHTEYVVTLHEFREVSPVFRMKDIKASNEDYLSQKYRLPHRIAKEDEEKIRQKYPNLWLKTSKGRTLDYFRKTYLPNLPIKPSVTQPKNAITSTSSSSSTSKATSNNNNTSKSRKLRASRKSRVKYNEDDMDEEEEEEEEEEFDDFEQDDDDYQHNSDELVESQEEEEAEKEQQQETQFQDEEDVEENQSEEGEEENVEEEESETHPIIVDIKPIIPTTITSNYLDISTSDRLIHTNNSSTLPFYYQFNQNNFISEPTTSDYLMTPIITHNISTDKTEIDETLLDNHHTSSSSFIVDDYFDQEGSLFHPVNQSILQNSNFMIEDNVPTKKSEKREDESGEIINRKISITSNSSAVPTSSPSSASSSNSNVNSSPNSTSSPSSSLKKKKSFKKRSNPSEDDDEMVEEEINEKNEPVKKKSLRKKIQPSTPSSPSTQREQQQKREQEQSQSSTPIVKIGIDSKKLIEPHVINIHFYGLRDCFAKCFSLDIGKFKTLDELEDAILRKCSNFDTTLNKIASTLNKSQLMSSTVTNEKNPNLFAILEYHDKVYRELTAIRQGRVTMENVRAWADYIDVYISSSPTIRKTIFR